MSPISTTRPFRLPNTILWLYSTRMHPMMMQRPPDIRRHLHKVVFVRRHHVYGRDRFRFRELPDVEVMQGKNAVDGEDGFTHVFKGDVRRDALEKDE
jgi:hypothetical protein